MVSKKYRDGVGHVRVALLLAATGLTVTPAAAEAQAQSGAVAAPDSSKPTSQDLGEIIVTANRRAQTLLDVPYNISAVTQDQLTRAGAVDLSSLARLVPGVIIPDLGSRGGTTNSNIIIRGLNVNDPGTSSFLPFASVPLVSTYVDDTPIYINLRLKDVQRVEVLRGPQGTLYGSGAVGGTIRFLFNKPDPSRLAASLSFDGSVTAHSNHGSYAVDGVLNVPLADDLAIRVAAGYNKLAGFIDASNAVVFGPNGQPVLADPANPLTSGLVTRRLSDINHSNTAYVRASALWKPSLDTTFELVYQHQKDNSYGYPVQTRGTPYVNQALIPVQPEHRTADLGALTVTQDLGFASLVSDTSYYDNVSHNVNDDSVFIESLNTRSPFYYGNYPRVTSPFYNNFHDSAFTEELRLVSKSGTPVEYVLGGFLQRERSRVTQVETVPGFAAYAALPGSADAINSIFGYPAFNTFDDVVTSFNGGTSPATISPTDAVYFFNRHATFHDNAVFGELTYHVTPKLQITGGARFFWQSYSQTLQQMTPVCGVFCSTLSPPDVSGTVIGGASKSFADHTLMANASYAFRPHLRAYFTFSQGFRHGGANGIPTGNCGLCDNPALVTFQPDTANNYELGIKGEVRRSLEFSLALYRIDWSDIQLQLAGGSGDPIVANGKGARSQGVELELNERFSPDIAVRFDYALADSKITDDFTVTDFNAAHPRLVILAAHAGNRLPFVPRHQISGGIDYTPQALASHKLLFHVDVAYRSDAYTGINASQRGFTRLAGFATINAAIQAEIVPQLIARIYGNNLTDAQGIVAGGNLAGTGADPRYNTQVLSRPRTFGIGVTYSFR